MLSSEEMVDEEEEEDVLPLDEDEDKLSLSSSSPSEVSLSSLPASARRSSNTPSPKSCYVGAIKS